MGRTMQRAVHRASPWTLEWAVPRVAGRFSDSETSWLLAGGTEGSFLCSLSSRFSGRGGGVGSLPRAWRRVGVPPAASVLKKFVRLASVFPSPPFRSSDFAGPRRPRLYGFHTSTRSLSNRKGRGRRRGGREREPRRAGEGRLVWNRNFCVLIDYRLWAAKSEGRPWVDPCIKQCIMQCIMQCLEHPPEPRSGLCPELLADFRIPNLLGARRGHRGQFSVQSDNRFSGGGGGVGSPPRAWRRVGVPRRSRC